MTLYNTNLCTKILHEYFGNIVGKVGQLLLEKGEKYLVSIYKELPDIAKPKIRDSIGILIQFNFVTFQEGRRGDVLYTIHHGRVVLMLRYVRYLMLIRELYDAQSEMVIDALLLEGQAPASVIIINSAFKISAMGTCNLDDLHITVKDKMLTLINDHFIVRCPAPKEKNKNIPDLSVNEDDLYYLPQDLLNLKALQSKIKKNRTFGDSDPQSGNSEKYGDEEILWRVNLDKFHIELRDNEVRNAIGRRINPLASECVTALLKVSYDTSDPWASLLNPITVSAIRDKLKDLKYLEDYLRILELDGGGLLMRHGDAGGGEYRINLSAMFRTLAESVVDGIVQERFGSKSARIFRLVRDRDMMEPDNISKLAMISKRDANIKTNELLRDKFLYLHEVRKSAVPSPATKNIFLYHVNMENIARTLVERCYKTIYNIMCRRHLTFNENKRLLEKQSRIEVIVGNLRSSGGTSAQIEEVEELLTPSEKQLVKQATGFQDRLDEKESAIDETIFILETYLYYANLKN